MAELGRGLRPSEAVLVSYLALTVAVLPLGRGHVPSWSTLAAVNLGLIAGLGAFARWTRPRSQVVALLRRMLPLFFIPILYTEVKYFNQLLFPGTFFDAAVIRWEEALFAGEVLPRVLHGWLPWTPLSEYLHFAYLAYYLVIPTPFVALALRRRWEDVELFLTALMVVFVACQLLFIAFPVAGPFHYYPPPDPRSMGRLFPPMVHAVLHAGSSVGTAFPSSHCAVAATCWIAVWGRSRGATILLAAIVPALTVGTVYGGFHYAVDALAGWALALLLWPVSRRLHRRLSARRDAA
jgi:membrane-associated phospholipid phosphatase